MRILTFQNFTLNRQSIFPTNMLLIGGPGKGGSISVPIQWTVDGISGTKAKDLALGHMPCELACLVCFAFSTSPLRLLLGFTLRMKVLFYFTEHLKFRTVNNVSNRKLKGGNKNEKLCLSLLPLLADVHHSLRPTSQTLRWFYSFLGSKDLM